MVELINTVSSNFCLVFFKMYLPIYLCSTYVLPCMPGLAYAVTGKFSQHTLINTCLSLSGFSCHLNLRFSSFCAFACVLCRFQEGITIYNVSLLWSHLFVNSLVQGQKLKLKLELMLVSMLSMYTSDQALHAPKV